jgi:hypothetical protein
MRLSHLLTFLAGGAIVTLVVFASGRDARPQQRAISEPRVDRLLARLDRLEILLAATEPAQPDVTSRVERHEMPPVESPDRAPVAKATRRAAAR